MSQKIVLTGDRPTGALHLGHYVGTLANRVTLQHEYKQYVLIADVQALTDNYDNPSKVRENVLQVALDYLAVGIDPAQTTIFIQSMIPEIAELTILLLNFVTVNRLQRNPTVKTEIKDKGLFDAITAGFLMYPIHQVADIAIVKGSLIPVGADQLPMIEQANEIIRSFNRTYNVDVLVEAEAIIPKIARLPGIDGKAKMSKSLNNAIFLGDDVDTIHKKVMQMYTDPDHVRVADPGKVEGNVVFMYLDIFDHDTHEVARLKQRYQQGGLGDVVLKKRLIEVLDTFLRPIREKRTQLATDPQAVMNILYAGTQAARAVAQNTMKQIKQVLQLNYFD